MKHVWSGFDEDPESDLCVKVFGNYFDVVNGCDGWTIKTPTDCWAHNGKVWVVGTHAAPPRGVPGAVTRDQAREYAEVLIDRFFRE